MSLSTIGLLHPGEMGTRVGSALIQNGIGVMWASEGRRPQSVERANKAGFTDVGTVAKIVETCDLIISICPPDAALDVAKQVAGFDGLFLDANAIAPATSRDVANIIQSEGGRYVDGALIGSSDRYDVNVQLYLSGAEAPAAALLFDRSSVDARILDTNDTAASALKMCYAAWTKGSQALLLDVRALSVAEGVEDALLRQWEGSDMQDKNLQAAKSALRKGWRWDGEMKEIAATFRDAGLPDGFHIGASEVFARIARDEHATASEQALQQAITELNA